MISITKLLQCVTQTSDLVEFKQSLMNELNISKYNESLLFSQILLLIYKQLSPNSIDNIKTKMIEINERNKNNGTCKCATSSNLKIDHFGRLSSDCIDYFATILTKKESIFFGYLNRDLYIESQKRSYLLKRQNRESLLITENYFDSKNVKYKIGNFSYGFPTHLVIFEGFNIHIGDDLAKQLGSQSLPVLQSTWFRSLFTRLDEFHCNHAKFLPFIPINIFFNKNKNNQSNNQKPINLFRINLQQTNSHFIQQNMQKFIDKYQQYFEQECKSNNQIIRNIDNLIVESRSGSISRPIQTQIQSTFFQGLRHNYRKLWIFHGVTLIIDTLTQFYDIFHSRLMFLCLGSQTQIKFNNLKQMRADFNENRIDCNIKQMRFEIVGNFSYKYDNKKLTHLIHKLDHFKLRQSCMTLAISIQELSFRIGNASHFGEREFFKKKFCTKLLNKLFMSKYTPNMSRICFDIVNDTSDLINTRRCFNYLISNGQRIAYIKSVGKLESITFEWRFEEQMRDNINTRTSNTQEWSFAADTIFSGNRDGTDDDSDSDEDNDDTDDSDDSDDDDYDSSDDENEYGDAADEDDIIETNDINDDDDDDWIYHVYSVESDTVVMKKFILTESRMIALFDQILDWFDTIRKQNKRFPRTVTLML